MERFKE